MDLVARPVGSDDPVVGAMLLLAFPEQQVAAEVVMILGQRLLLDPGDEQDDDFFARGVTTPLAIAWCDSYPHRVARSGRVYLIPIDKKDISMGDDTEALDASRSDWRFIQPDAL